MCIFIYLFIYLYNCKSTDDRSSVYVTIDCWVELLFREVICFDLHTPFSASAVGELLLSCSQAVLYNFIPVLIVYRCCEIVTIHCIETETRDVHCSSLFFFFSRWEVGLELSVTRLSWYDLVQGSERLWRCVLFIILERQPFIFLWLNTGICFK